MSDGNLEAAAEKLQAASNYEVFLRSEPVVALLGPFLCRHQHRIDSLRWMNGVGYRPKGRPPHEEVPLLR